MTKFNNLKIYRVKVGKKKTTVKERNSKKATII